jgi:hypothetical protein
VEKNLLEPPYSSGVYLSNIPSTIKQQKFCLGKEFLQRAGGMWDHQLTPGWSRSACHGGKLWWSAANFSNTEPQPEPASSKLDKESTMNPGMDVKEDPVLLHIAKIRYGEASWRGLIQHHPPCKVVSNSTNQKSSSSFPRRVPPCMCLEERSSERSLDYLFFSPSNFFLLECSRSLKRGRNDHLRLRRLSPIFTWVPACGSHEAFEMG